MSLFLDNYSNVSKCGAAVSLLFVSGAVIAEQHWQARNTEGSKHWYGHCIIAFIHCIPCGIGLIAAGIECLAHYIFTRYKARHTTSSQNIQDTHQIIQQVVKEENQAGQQQSGSAAGRKDLHNQMRAEAQCPQSPKSDIHENTPTKLMIQKAVVATKKEIPAHIMAVTIQTLPTEENQTNDLSVEEMEKTLAEYSAKGDDVGRAARIIGEEYLKGSHSRKKDEQRALKWLEKSASLQDYWAAYELGCYYRDLSPSNINAAIHWYTEAANLGNTLAMDVLVRLLLTDLYSKDKDTQKNLELAMEWTEKHQKTNAYSGLLRHHLGDALEKHASNYDSGKNGITKNYKKAVYWYQKAANYGNSKAARTLATAYEFEHMNLKKDMEQVIYWSTVEASTLVGWEAMFRLGSIYFSGKNGVPVNLEKAIEWFEKYKNETPDADAYAALELERAKEALRAQESASKLGAQELEEDTSPPSQHQEVLSPTQEPTNEILTT